MSTIDISKTFAFFVGEKRALVSFKGRRAISMSIIQLPMLTTPTISLDGDILTMTATDAQTEEFVIFVDGVEVKSVAPTPPILFNISEVGSRGGYYVAKSGMTWDEWVESEYNMDGWYIDAYDGKEYVTKDGHGGIELTDRNIIANASYQCEPYIPT